MTNAIANQIPIYFICISDFNTAVLSGYANLTGGKVFKAKTTEEINQICGEIGENAFDGEKDTDGDGFSDVEEMSGLLVDSSCNPIKTDYMKPDTDDDGLDDNEEVDVELTKVEIPGKQGNPSIVKYYHHMWSDPSLQDSDGDGLDDGEDLFPLEKMTEDEKLLRNFFDSAREFEIYYLAKFCTRFEVSPIECIKYINVYRQYEDYDLYGVQQGLAEIGEKCDISSLKLFYGEYVNYKNGTSWAEIQTSKYEEWYSCFQWFMAEWMLGVSKQLIENSNTIIKDTEDVVRFNLDSSNVINRESAEETNAWWKANGYDNSPYKPGTKVTTIELTEDTKFVRVYDGKISNQQGGWVMNYEEIKGLSPTEIKDKYALQNIPEYICDVEIPKGSKIRVGIANSVPKWGNGGGIQYDLMGQRIGKFYNERLI